ncbi:MAG TPA: glucose-6-phosphate dehydrogenase assembly protein OpcA [Thermoanaerobaculia bacterium]|nr:glucose-6-phosphate dehydrogenase assembly protein OpcA [Thermoanaerobaculia bacterium]
MTDALDPLKADVAVDPSAIEKNLAELWRASKEVADDALTRAALWNVVAHTNSQSAHSQASEVLGRASATVPQRTIVVRSDPAAPPQIESWIGANCHMVGGGKQVCSEEIAIVAGGDRIHRVPPLVNALLIPDMPVAVWWLGDLPNEHEEYVLALLDPADRLIVDSVNFDSPADLMLVNRVSAKTTTTPADLNWVRLEEWRAATASIFDPPHMRARLQTIRRVRVVAGTSGNDYFGESVEALLYASWISAQLGHHVEGDSKVEGPLGAIDYRIEKRRQENRVGGITFVEIGFDDGSGATISRDREKGVLVSNVDGVVSMPEAVTRAVPCNLDELIVRQLKRARGDQVLLKVLPIASRLARRVAA